MSMKLIDYIKIIAGIAGLGLLVLLIVAPDVFLQGVLSIIILVLFYLLLFNPDLFFKVLAIIVGLGLFVLLFVAPSMAFLFALFLFVFFVKHGKPF